MENYLINEVIEFHCDGDGLLSVTFRLEGDPEEQVRVLENDEYYFYAEDISKEQDTYMSKEWEEGDFEGEGHYYSQFDFKEWLEYEHDEGTVKSFIYEIIEKEDLPELVNE